MKTVHKACPCVIRRTDGYFELLAFRHPLAGLQIAKGTVDPGESTDRAALRELKEESGLEEARILTKIGIYERITGAGPGENGASEKHIWHLYHVEAKHPANLDFWSHEASGSPEEEGLEFSFFWLKLNGKYNCEFHPIFIDIIRLVEEYLNLTR